MKSIFSHYATGLSGFPDARRRETELANGLRLMAEQCGTSLDGGLQIDAYGEIVLKTPAGKAYGERFVAYIAKHGSRTGWIVYGYNSFRAATDTWCKMNHFSVEAMLRDYFAPYDAESFTDEVQPANPPGYAGEPPAGLDYDTWLAMNNID